MRHSVLALLLALPACVGAPPSPPRGADGEGSTQAVSGNGTETGANDELGATTEGHGGTTSAADSGPGTIDSSAGNTGSTTGPGCRPGEQGCACSEDACDPGLRCIDDTCVQTSCGDGVVDDGEECDDMNGVDGDGCDDDCTLSTGVAQIEAGFEHVCAVDFLGQMKCWGNGNSGRLGYPGQSTDLGDNEVPADYGYVDVGAPVAEMALGDSFTCVRLETNDVICWGNGSQGQLGQGDEEDLGLQSPPSTIPPISLPGVVTQISAGAQHACARFVDGGVSCWGRNNFGQLGQPGALEIGSEALPSDFPLVDVGGFVEQVEAGREHTCARLDDGSVRCWGRGGQGALGTPNNEEDIGDDEVPADALPVSLDGPAIDLSAGFQYTCAILEGGEIQCWGEGFAGQLGYGRLTNIGDDEEVDSTTPVQLPAPATHIATGQRHTCARLADSTLFCWGEGNEGKLGSGSTGSILDPLSGQVDVAKAQGPAEVKAGRHFSCARTTGGEIKCWGRNSRGQLGQGAAFLGHLGDDELLSAAGAIPFEE